MDAFHVFAQAVNKKFTEMSKGELFTISKGDALFQLYLDSFPEGTNPIYLKNTEHDCNCCKNFIRNLGTLVSLEGGKVTTVWDLKKLPYPYDVVAAKMDAFVRGEPITSIYRTKQRGYGSETTRQQLESGGVKQWKHFWGTVANRHHMIDIGSAMGASKEHHDQIKRGYEELTEDALKTVLELIKNNSIYRGAEFKSRVELFLDDQRKYKKLSATEQEIVLWQKHDVATLYGFRNSAIGTLVQDLSKGVELEDAVRMYESKVAPQNYQRTTSLVTQKMVKDALKTIEELGLEPALKRRTARMSDLSVNNVLWVDGEAKRHMQGGLAELLLKAVPKAVVQVTGAKEITIQEFLEKVLPKATSMEMLLASHQTNKMMTLTAPEATGEIPKLFKWNNNFAWSYDGNVTDSITQRVKEAGGNVNAKLRISLSWFNTDDLDIHVYPPNGQEIYFGNRQGCLDVDMNAFGGLTDTPVENVSFTAPKNGKYIVSVNNFRRRNTSDVGCTIQIAVPGSLINLSHPTAIRDGDTHEICQLEYKDGKIVYIRPSLGVNMQSRPQEVNGVTTENFVKVNTVLNSPNHWDGQEIGNKHVFFILEGCKMSGEVRGIYNEFLSNELTKHRKVFELMGEKTKCTPADDQLSGLGFSLTQEAIATVKVVTGSKAQVYNIKF